MRVDLPPLAAMYSVSICFLAALKAFWRLRDRDSTWEGSSQDVGRDACETEAASLKLKLMKPEYCWKQQSRSSMLVSNNQHFVRISTFKVHQKTRHFIIVSRSKSPFHSIHAEALRHPRPDHQMCVRSTCGWNGSSFQSFSASTETFQSLVSGLPGSPRGSSHQNAQTFGFLWIRKW